MVVRAPKAELAQEEYSKRSTRYAREDRKGYADEEKIWNKKTPSGIIRASFATAHKNQKGVIHMDELSISHTRWSCTYHIIFIPKYRRKVIYGKLRKDIGIILRQLCGYKGVEIVEANACIDHIHMLVRIPPKMSVSSFMGYLKGKSSLMIFDKHANLKYKYGNRHFWAKGYYVSTVGLNKATVKKYIQEQEDADRMMDKQSIKEHEDPFKG